MRKRRKLLTIVTCGAFAVAALAFLRSEKEPAYRGRPLSHWIALYNQNEPTSQPEAAEALETIGTNALPCLLNWIAYEPPRWRTRLGEEKDTEFGGRLPWMPLWATDYPGRARAGEAMVAFKALGARATSAIPRLLLLATNQSKRCSGNAIIALQLTGPAAIPALLHLISNHALPPELRFSATRALNELLYPAMLKGTLGTNADAAVPLLIQNLNDNDPYVAGEAASVLGTLRPDPDISIPALSRALGDAKSVVRDRAAAALGQFRDRASPAVPYLIEALADSDPDVRQSATNSILKIAPQTLTNAAPQ
jgi:hypothetical protein